VIDLLASWLGDLGFACDAFAVHERSVRCADRRAVRQLYAG
jgi:hypothetical protein